MATQALRHVVVVLHEPQDPVNIGAVVRAMKNMGLGRLRLVNPGDFDPYRIHGVAHTGMDVIESAEICDRLADAVADARLVLGTTARERRARRNYRRPRDAAAEILAAASEGGEVAVVFGREDCGLTNDDLDRCDRVIVIPTHPDHPSLNLAQAVMIVAYELWTAAAGERPFKPPRRAAARAGRAELEALVAEIEASLHAVDFFKSHQVTAVMRTVRDVAARADLDAREAALFKAMAREVRNYIARLEARGRP